MTYGALHEPFLNGVRGPLRAAGAWGMPVIFRRDMHAVIAHDATLGERNCIFLIKVTV